nr:ABC transporter ATP-binding protein [Paenibacillus sp. MMS18-CY102]
MILRIYWWVLSFLFPYKWQLLTVLACSMVISGIELAIPKFIEHLIDQIMSVGHFSNFGETLAVMAGLLIIMFGISALRMLVQRHMQEKAASDLQFRIIQQLRTLGYSYFEKHAVGESLSLVNTELNAVQNIYRSAFPSMVNELIFAALSFGFMFSIHAGLSLLIIPFFGLYYVMGPYFEKKAANAQAEWGENRIRYNRKIYESVSAISELRANGAQPWDYRQFMDKRQAMDDGMVRTFWYSFLRGSVRRFCNNLGAIAIFIVGFYLIKDGAISIGAFTAFMLYYFNSIFKLTVVVTLITEQRLQMVQAKRIYDFMHLEPEVKEKENARAIGHVEGKIDFDRVSFHYGDGSHAIIHDFSLSVQSGEKVALVGLSGGGKSTLTKLIGRFYDPKQGEIRLDNVPLADMKLSDLRNSMGFVFQDTFLFGSTIEENIRFGNPDASDEEVIAAAKAAYADEFIQQLPMGYATVVGERGVKLSGGQKQRISIARMFVKNPSIVVLDEATSALDNISELEVKKALDALLQGRTTIAVAHRLSTIANYDRIVVVHEGKAAEVGSYNELLALGGIFYQMVHGNDSTAILPEVM